MNHALAAGAAMMAAAIMPLDAARADVLLDFMSSTGLEMAKGLAAGASPCAVERRFVYGAIGAGAGDTAAPRTFHNVATSAETAPETLRTALRHERPLTVMELRCRREAAICLVQALSS